MPRFLDLFAGAGGLSEGFIQAGYTPIAHVEMDAAACYTLKTRAAFHWLRANGNIEIYKGIRNTILNEPSMFFAYNNGITATAYAVEVESGDGCTS